MHLSDPVTRRSLPKCQQGEQAFGHAGGGDTCRSNKSENIPWLGRLSCRCFATQIFNDRRVLCTPCQWVQNVLSDTVLRRTLSRLGQQNMRHDTGRGLLTRTGLRRKACPFQAPAVEARRGSWRRAAAEPRNAASQPPLLWSS